VIDERVRRATTSDPARPPEIAPAATPPPVAAAAPDDDQRADRDRVLAALEACAGNQTRAAKMLGIGRTTLLKKLSQYGIARPRK